MKKIYLILTIFGFLITFGYYATGQNTQCLAKSGCCSHHKGVSHCGAQGYYICNDGTRSPSCRCK